MAVSRAGLLYYVHSDHLGGTNILSDVAGNEAGAVRYHAFGRTRVETGTMPMDKKFTGQTLDDSTGLYFYGARYYDCWLSLFVQPDSIVPQPGNPQSLNRYSYGYNNPVKYSDPTGHSPIDDGVTQPQGLPPDGSWDNQWAEAYRAAHGGQDPTWGDWKDRLFSLEWAGSGAGGAWTAQDWQDYGTVSELLGPLASQAGASGRSQAVDFYSEIGAGLAAGIIAPRDSSTHFAQGPDGTAIVRSDGVPQQSGGAWTWGNVIILKHDSKLTKSLLVHEYVHALQYRAHGWRFMPEYMKEGVANWGANRYEQQAIRVQNVYVANPNLPPPWVFPRRTW